MSENSIIELLKATQLQSLALYSNFRVSAVLITGDKQFITGINIESSSYGLTICAERVALFKALSEGQREFKRIYIMGDSSLPCLPCGACLQVLSDYAADIEVIMYSRDAAKKQMRYLKELLPYPFEKTNLLS